MDILEVVEDETPDQYSKVIVTSDLHWIYLDWIILDFKSEECSIKWEEI